MAVACIDIFNILWCQKNEDQMRDPVHRNSRRIVNRLDMVSFYRILYTKTENFFIQTLAHEIAIQKTCHKPPDQNETVVILKKSSLFASIIHVGMCIFEFYKYCFLK